MSDYSELKRLAEAATPGDWTCSDKHDGRFWHIHSGNQSIGSTHAASKMASPSYANMFEANARFIAVANPAAVLALIAENGRLKSDLNESNDLVEHLGDKRKALTAERDQLKAENEHLRKLPTCWSEVLEQAEANDELLDKVLELSADAERYRFLCDKFGETKLPCALERILAGDLYVADGKPSIDSAIDAAMSKEAKHD